MADSYAVARPQGRSTADIVATVVEMVLYVLLLLMLSMAGLMLSMMSDSCGSGAGECRTDRIVDGMGISAALIWVPFVLAFVMIVVRGVRGGLMWWIPLVAGLVSVGIFVVGFLVAASGVPS